MNPESRWRQLAAQQLVRYEALFTLLDSIQVLEDITAIAQRVSRHWKYFANVTSWRLVLSKPDGFLVVDGSRGDAWVSETVRLSAWDEYHWTLKHPRLVRASDPWQTATPPSHLGCRPVKEIQILPLLRLDRRIGLLSVSARRDSFTDLDTKFVRLCGGHLADRLLSVLMHRQATELLITKATRDGLTGLLNRGAIIERLGDQLTLARRAEEPLSVVIADIDFFKVINDSRGHLAGDEVLRELARRLGLQTRSHDALGRYGGEEFLFVLYPCEPAEAAEAAERFRRAIAETPFILDAGDRSCLDVTISLGAASTRGAADSGMQSLLKRADDALYASKADGRNRVTVSGES
jgi:diguanylate cyclase (GGDEF)-like protein